MSDVEPFETHVPDEVLDDLRRRLKLTRFPDQIPDTGWEYGIPTSYVHELATYWLEEYDWRAQEARLNELDHFRTEIDGQVIHFVHQRSADPDAFPLLITHGWPGSIVEFPDLFPLLADDFHVIAPSVPGYAWSPPPTEPGWDTWRIARAKAELMARLGYERYGAQGGDWGAQVTTRLAVHDPDHCVAIHLNMPIADPPDEPVELTDQDKADLAALQQFQRDESAHAALQTTKPQTLGMGLSDSPAGLLAWIVEKFKTWSDCDGHPENVFTKDQLITNVMTYWTTGTAASAARLYWEHVHGMAKQGNPDYVATPTAIARFPKEVVRYPRSWVERRYNVVSWTDMKQGGHFAAMEQAELLAQSLGADLSSIEHLPSR